MTSTTDNKIQLLLIPMGSGRLGTSFHLKTPAGETVNAVSLWCDGVRRYQGGGLDFHLDRAAIKDLERQAKGKRLRKPLAVEVTSCPAPTGEPHGRYFHH